MDSDNAKYMILITLIFVVGGAIIIGWFALDSIKQFQQRTILRNEGREIVGTVTKLSQGRGSETVRYSFTIEGKDFLGKARVPDRLGFALHVRDRIVVRFLPSDPTVNHPEAWEWSAFTDIFRLGFQVFYALLVAVAWIFLGRERSLVREGKAVPGVVTSCISKDRQFQVGYEFRTEDGTLITGKSGSEESYETGSHIWVLYLPQRPQRNCSYPLPDYRVAD